LGSKANIICTAYKNAERFFPPRKVRLTGNPIRKEFIQPLPEQRESKKALGLRENRLTLLVLGGSLGARTVNEQISHSLEVLVNQGWDIFWQCGKLYEEEYMGLNREGVVVRAFIEDMATAYAAADAIVSRAGAGTLSELCLVAKAAVLIPSPNVAEDHQTHNARALSDKGAAILIPERDLDQRFDIELKALARNEARRNRLAENIKKLAHPRATEDIVDLVEKLVRE
jgi:UDP-N-acetylglucosamine--N-acetylmuramyl-(pentapeptide) pyrophosphoryl-undecaprenol N-acetylglucosamine transferase